VYKKILRKKLLNYRKKNFNFLKINYSQIKLILDKIHILKITTVGAYYPINHEIDCLGILKKLEQFGYKISLPVTRKKKEMDFFEWSFNEPLKIGYMGIPEPYKLKKVYPDVLIVPLIAFDKFKYRLGYGGGYYDRYIDKISSKKKLFTFGLAYSFQEVKKLPKNSHDKKLDFVLTEKNIK
tara:strand:- start:641 stop:1183 length:543 start_codon:yes stop_codon:yes gene_type:complete